LIKIGSKFAEKNSAQTNKPTNRHYDNNGHLAVNQKILGRFYFVFSKYSLRVFRPSLVAGGSAAAAVMQPFQT